MTRPRNAARKQRLPAGASTLSDGALRELQRNEIFAAIEKAGLDPSAFDMTDDGAEVRVERTMSVFCFTLYRDKTWRYLGTNFIGYGAEKPFDGSWRAVIPLISLWIAEVKGDHGALDVLIGAPRGRRSL